MVRVSADARGIPPTRRCTGRPKTFEMKKRKFWPASELERWAVTIEPSSLRERVLKFVSPRSLRAVAAFVLAGAGANAFAQATWQADTRSVVGPIAQVALPDSGNRRRTAFIAFEFARSCDPIFSFAEITGSKFGTPVSQAVLKDSKIGVLLNGKFYTWHAAMTKYDNGYEAGFGVTNELLLQFLINLESLVYVTPVGERVSLPTTGFRQAVQSAIDVCRKRVK